MARTQRRRRDQRRPTDTTAAATPAARPATSAVRAAATARSARPGSRAGTARAIGEPSAQLLKAATWERGYVVKDFRRLGVTVIGVLVLLALAGFAENALLR